MMIRIGNLFTRILTANEFGRIRSGGGCFVPNAISKSKAFLFIVPAIRESMDRWIFPDGDTAADVPFPIADRSTAIQVIRLVTNMDWDGERLIHWHRDVESRKHTRDER